jgi:HSP20 family molecular chaperone IbpA
MFVKRDHGRKVVSQWRSPTFRKENVKVVANDDYSITISHLNNEGKRCTRTLDSPDTIDSETGKATYKNGILEVTFDRQ